MFTRATTLAMVLLFIVKEEGNAEPLKVNSQREKNVRFHLLPNIPSSAYKPAQLTKEEEAEARKRIQDSVKQFNPNYDTNLNKRGFLGNELVPGNFKYVQPSIANKTMKRTKSSAGTPSLTQTKSRPLKPSNRSGIVPSATTPDISPHSKP